MYTPFRRQITIRKMMSRDTQNISTRFKYKWTNPINAHGLGSVKRSKNTKYFKTSKSMKYEILAVDNWRLVSLIGNAPNAKPFCKRPDLVKHHHWLRSGTFIWL